MYVYTCKAVIYITFSTTNRYALLVLNIYPSGFCLKFNIKKKKSN